MQAVVGNSKVARTLAKGNLIDSARTRYFQESITDLGTIEIPSPGVYELKLRAQKINPKASAGIVLAGTGEGSRLSAPALTGGSG